MSEEKQYIMSLDQGTTSTRAILFDNHGKEVHKHQVEFGDIRPEEGWTEHDPIVIWDTVKECLYECMKYARTELGIAREQVCALGVANQRETTIVWNRHTGVPLYNAIVWHDTRTHHICQRLRDDPASDVIQRISGLRISTYFSALKLRWLIENVPVVAAAIEDGSAIFGTVDTWLVWNLTKGQQHVTDVTNAGRSMLMNIDTLDWDDKLLRFVDVPRSILPNIRSCSEEFGHIADVLPESELQGLVISGIIGDQQGALVGQTCFDVGQGKNTYGTGSFLIVNTGPTPIFSTHGLLTTPAYKFGKDACVYSLEGSVAFAGSAVKWLQESLGIIGDPHDVGPLASTVDDTGDVYVVPAFSGLFAPWWREDARGIIVGMTNKTNKAHIARATLESIAFQVNDVYQAVSEDMGEEITHMRVDGGGSANDLLLQIQAEVIGSGVMRPQVKETTALGAAFAAGLAVGVFKSVDELREYWHPEIEFEPSLWGQEERDRKLIRWKKAVDKSLDWVVDEEDVNESDPAAAEEPAAQESAEEEHATESKLLTKEGLASATVGFAMGSIATVLLYRCMKK